MTRILILRAQGDADNAAHVPVAQLDKASDYESEDWGFKSLPGYTSFARHFDTFSCSLRSRARSHSPSAWMPERSKGADLRSAGCNVRVGSNPTSGILSSLSPYSAIFLARSCGATKPVQPPWPNG